MRTDKVLTLIAAMAALVAALAVAPAANAEPETYVRHQGPVHVTVHKRSYLHPGTETKSYAEHRSDYYRDPTYSFDPMRNSTLFNSGPGLPFYHDRMPFPNCLDLAGFCQ